jgi:hypothetical protein
MDDFKSVKQNAQELRSNYVTRDGILDEMYNMYKLYWDEQTYVESRGNNIKVTKSPDPRNAVMGIVRLMTTVAPIFKVGYDLNDQAAVDISNEIEKLASILIESGGRVRGTSLVYDVVMSAAIFGEFIIGVTSTQDLVDAAKGAVDAVVARAERVAKITPYLYEVYDPRNCYPVMDALGLRAICRRSELTAGEIKERFGADAERSLKGKAKTVTSSQLTVLWDWWDLEQRCVWVDGGNEPIMQEAHGLPFIPFVCQVVEGSRMFTEPDEQRDPPLYTYYESGLWKRQNLALTAIYQAIAAMGLNPQFVQEMGPSQEAVVRDFSTPGGVFMVPQGSKFYPMGNKGLIDPSTMVGLEIAERKGEESTIFKAALGANVMGGSVAFSTVALLSQQGRLPLVGIQKKVSWGIADAALLAIRWMKLSKKQYKLTYAENSAEINAKDIPDNLHLECQVDISLPQDRLQSANIANMLVQSGIVDRAWVREHVLQITNPKAVDDQLMAEQTQQALFAEWVKVFVQAETQKFAREFMPELGPGMAGPGMPGAQGMPPQGMPMQEQMPPQQPGPMGVEGMQGGMPPEMAAMGGQPIPGQMGEGMPPEEYAGGMLE